MPKVEHLVYGDRKVFTVSAFNRGIGLHLGRLPTLWVEGEVTELRRNDAWANVFLTLKDPTTGATLGATIARRTFDRLELELDEGESVHVAGRAELYEQKAELGFRATTIERIGLGGHLLALEQLKRKLAAEGLFAAERKRRLPRVPRAVGILTGADAAARGDLVATIGARFPAAKVVICETRLQGKGAAAAIVSAIAALDEPPRGRRARARARRRKLRRSPSVQRRSPSSARSQPPAFPSSRLSATSRTRRSATSQPTRAQRRRRPQERSSSRTSSSSSPRWPRHGDGSISPHERTSTAGAARSSGRASACAGLHDCCSSDGAPHSITRARGSRRSRRSRP